jgi:AmmeMemoRadiSam system protein B
MKKLSIRKAVYSGSFYPADGKELSEMINGFLSKAKPKKLSGELMGLIVPHAGYIYSGPTAAFGYKVLSETKLSKIILFGPSHHNHFYGAFGFSGAWETPLGVTLIEETNLTVLKNDSEHCLEVQLPFLQSTLPSFDFAPILYGEIDPQELAQKIEAEYSLGTVLIASSDLSHYLSYGLAQKVDSQTINAIMELNYEKFIGVGDACGKIGIAALILIAKKNNWKPVLLDYRNSGDTAGDKKGVVGYVSIAFVKEK